MIILFLTCRMPEKLDEKIGSFDLKGMAEKSKILVNDLANIDKQIAQFEFERETRLEGIGAHPFT